MLIYLSATWQVGGCVHAARRLCADVHHLFLRPRTQKYSQNMHVDGWMHEDTNVHNHTRVLHAYAHAYLPRTEITQLLSMFLRGFTLSAQNTLFHVDLMYLPQQMLLCCSTQTLAAACHMVTCIAKPYVRQHVQNKMMLMAVSPVVAMECRCLAWSAGAWHPQKRKEKYTATKTKCSIFGHVDAQWLMQGAFQCSHPWL